MINCKKNVLSYLLISAVVIIPDKGKCVNSTAKNVSDPAIVNFIL